MMDYMIKGTLLGILPGKTGKNYKLSLGSKGDEFTTNIWFYFDSKGEMSYSNGEIITLGDIGKVGIECAYTTSPFKSGVIRNGVGKPTRIEPCLKEDTYRKPEEPPASSDSPITQAALQTALPSGDPFPPALTPEESEYYRKTAVECWTLAEQITEEIRIDGPVEDNHTFFWAGKLFDVTAKPLCYVRGVK